MKLHANAALSLNQRQRMVVGLSIRGGRWRRDSAPRCLTRPPGSSAWSRCPTSRLGPVRVECRGRPAELVDRLSAGHTVDVDRGLPGHVFADYDPPLSDVGRGRLDFDVVLRGLRIRHTDRLPNDPSISRANSSVNDWPP